MDLTYGLAACFFALCCFFEGLQPIFGCSLGWPGVVEALLAEQL
jgi:hypothetical protein